MCVCETKNILLEQEHDVIILLKHKLIYQVLSKLKQISVKKEG